jgi:hypothetical protein
MVLKDAFLLACRATDVTAERVEQDRKVAAVQLKRTVCCEVSPVSVPPACLGKTIILGTKMAQKDTVSP